MSSNRGVDAANHLDMKPVLISGQTSAANKILGGVMAQKIDLKGGKLLCYSVSQPKVRVHKIRSYACEGSGLRDVQVSCL